jgi:hypothetical protein
MVLDLVNREVVVPNPFSLKSCLNRTSLAAARYVLMWPLSTISGSSTLIVNELHGRFTSVKANVCQVHQSIRITVSADECWYSTVESFFTSRARETSNIYLYPQAP